MMKIRNAFTYFYNNYSKEDVFAFYNQNKKCTQTAKLITQLQKALKGTLKVKRSFPEVNLTEKCFGVIWTSGS